MNLLKTLDLLVEDVDFTEAVGIDELAGVVLVVAALGANACYYWRLQIIPGLKLGLMI